ncbi:alpha/beta fold hydrolase [Haliangium ochraceum]|uniref:Serine aminopeptidase S33 domain-containing protein n=1 Tax=Haliangium ochraceum (strain DSM 14365 / JCM 11303 / SMP-2) TaxID=502025 RepID=D0LK45_HALO1|nr:alpha/beta fold hydrolase [Haliangium ochraceum]ACY13079.1 conserved hypothetical protein [Haliangium ochraceum DSM 14365]
MGSSDSQSPASSADESAPAGEREVAIAAVDGVPLMATLFAPEPAGDARGRVLVGAATGVRRGYYRRFARALAAAGFEVISFDYRGIGDSAPPRLRGFEASMADWGARDTEGVLRWALARSDDDGLPLSYVGHSVGGQVLPLAASAQELAAVLLVASSAGPRTCWPLPERLVLAVFWWLLVPLCVLIFGRLPGRAMLAGEDLPGGVALQWARWGRHPDYLLGELPEVFDNAQRIAVPVRVISIDDDRYAPRPAVDSLAAWYGPYGAERVHVQPSEIGAEHIGHFGYFRAEREGDLWADAIEWLSEAGRRPRGE